MTIGTHRVDVHRQAGWLPESQDDLESCLAGHKDRVEANGEIVFRPVIRELQELTMRIR